MPNETGGDPTYMDILDELRELHITKSGGYGTSSDTFANFTAVGTLADEPRFLYPILRSVEKLTRCLSLVDQGRFSELGEEFKDVASLMVCAESLRRMDGEEK